MKQLNNSFLFKLTFLLLINVFIDNLLLLILSCLYLLFFDFKKLLIFITCLIIIFLCNNKADFIKYGIVDESYESYQIVDKLLYKTKVYDCHYEVGDVVKFESASKNIDVISQKKQNILFVNYGNTEYVTTIITRKYINELINNYDENIQNYFKKILLNDNIYDSDIEYLGYGFSFYYLLLMIFKKDKRISLILMILYILFFGFQIKFILIIIDYFFNNKDLDNLKRMFIKIILILIINKYLILNYSIFLTFIYSILLNSEYKAKSNLFILQSVLFNQIQPIYSLFYREIIKIRIFIFIFSLITLFIKPLESLYLKLIRLFINLNKVLGFSIRGKLTIISIFLCFVIFKLFKIKKDYLKQIVICLVLILPINNPLFHLNFIDVGQGDASLIHGSFNSYNILIDTGSKYNYSKLKRSLYAEGIYEIDYLIITHNDEDHNGNLENILSDFKVINLITEGIDIKNKEIELNYIYLGDYDNDNDNSLVYLLNIDDRKVLYTGDISKQVENIIVNKYGITNIDILKVAHHGSKNSTSKYFVSNLLPEIAIISTNGKYNHPSSEVLENLNGYLVKTYITKSSGNINIYFNKWFDLLITAQNECYIMD